MLVDSRSIGTDLIDLGERRQPFGAFSFHACPVLPQGKLHLVRDMPQTALKKDVALPFEPIEDGGASIRHQKKALELFESLQALPEEAVPSPVVGADIDSGHPDRSPFHVLDQNLHLLVSLLGSANADSCQPSDDQEFVAATRALHLQLPESHSREGRQNIRGLGMARFPDKRLVISAVFPEERLLFSGHQKLSDSAQDLLDKIPQKGGKENGKDRQDGRQPSIRQAPWRASCQDIQPISRRVFLFKIFFQIFIFVTLPTFYRILQTHKFSLYAERRYRSVL